MRDMIVMGRGVPLIIMLTALASCAPNIVPTPGGGRPTGQAPAPRPPYRSDPRPVAPVQAPPAALTPPGDMDWLDWALTPGNWTYARDGGSTVARFGTGGAVQAWVRCDLATRGVAVGRASRVAQANAMLRVRTTFGTVEWPARAVGGATPGVEAVRSASDPGLDQMAFSRGRIALLLGDQPAVVIPSWAEPVRVIEDCRG